MSLDALQESIADVRPLKEHLINILEHDDMFLREKIAELIEELENVKRMD